VNFRLDSVSHRFRPCHPAVVARIAVGGTRHPVNAFQTCAAATGRQTRRVAVRTRKFRIGKAIHTLEIRGGHYVRQAVTKTVCLVNLFKSFELAQFSSGSYTRYGLQPEQFPEKRKESSGTQRNTALDKLLTVRRHKMHAPNEECLDIWLAQEYRLFPVRMRYFERNVEIAGEAVITDIRVSDEQGARNNAVN
jgi:hypothetical protein